MKVIAYVLFIILLLGLPLASSAQEPEYKSYHWDSIPKLHQLGQRDQLLPELVLKETHILEYVLNNNTFIFT